MKGKILIVMICICIAVLPICLTACSGADGVTLEELAVGTQRDDADGDSGESVTFSVWQLPETWYNFGIILKRWAPAAMIVSFLAGLAIYDVFKKNKEVQKWAFSLLMLRIPLVILLVVYIYTWLYGVFNM